MFCVPRRSPQHFASQCSLQSMIKNGSDPSNIVILKDYWPTTDRSTIEGEAYKNLYNAFGVANIRAIYRADYGTGQPQTTSIYLPNNDDATCKKWRYEIFTPVAKQPEPRVRMLVVMSSRGKSLLDCDLGRGLAMKFAHAMLGKFIFLKSIPQRTKSQSFICHKAG